MGSKRPSPVPPQGVGSTTVSTYSRRKFTLPERNEVCRFVITYWMEKGVDPDEPGLTRRQLSEMVKKALRSKRRSYKHRFRSGGSCEWGELLIKHVTKWLSVYRTEGCAFGDLQLRRHRRQGWQTDNGGTVAQAARSERAWRQGRVDEARSEEAVTAAGAIGDFNADFWTVRHNINDPDGLQSLLPVLAKRIAEGNVSAAELKEFQNIRKQVQIETAVSAVTDIEVEEGEFRRLLMVRLASGDLTQAAVKELSTQRDKMLRAVRGSKDPAGSDSQMWKWLTRTDMRDWLLQALGLPRQFMQEVAPLFNGGISEGDSLELYNVQQPDGSCRTVILRVESVKRETYVDEVGQVREVPELGVKS